LLDGTHVVTRSKVRVFRDSQGRLRIENFQMRPHSEEIEDSPSFANIIDPVAGYQYSLTFRARIATRMEIGPPHVIQAPSPAASGSAAPRPPITRLPEPQFQYSEESLGTQTIEGLEVEGTKQTTTFPPHYFGNDAPIVTTNEEWYSPEFKFALLTIRSDPRMGETKVQVTDISRAEPDPSLFQVPSDYTIRAR